ncbi:unnamed protein product [Protopolystoma xenopodis]|uniref:Uncharacterized protein n=1 Tax=Protopolystoma xenopodis TaxID=117903 RepID=A0A448WCI5_9PLAT|nr:unnamed protein product [Protopolystoma xenopodis]
MRPGRIKLSSKTRRYMFSGEGRRHDNGGGVCYDRKIDGPDASVLPRLTLHRAYTPASFCSIETPTASHGKDVKVDKEDFRSSPVCQGCVAHYPVQTVIRRHRHYSLKPGCVNFDPLNAFAMRLSAGRPECRSQRQLDYAGDYQMETLPAGTKVEPRYLSLTGGREGTLDNSSSHSRESWAGTGHEPSRSSVEIEAGAGVSGGLDAVSLRGRSECSDYGTCDRLTYADIFPTTQHRNGGSANLSEPSGELVYFGWYP